MNEEELRAWMRAALRARGIPAEAFPLPVEQLQAVLRRLEALDSVDASGEEPGAFRWEGP